MSDNPYATPDAELQTQQGGEPSFDPKLSGLGGWLILVGIGVVLSPLRIAFEMFGLYVGVFQDGVWASLTTPGSGNYIPLIGPLIIGEAMVNVILGCVWVCIAYLFFSKKRVFPKWYIGVMAFTVGFILVDAAVVKAILPQEPMFDRDTARELARSLIAACIWIPYMLVSKRVKATFRD